MSNIFTHSGDIGDIIYSLPAIKAQGGGSLILFDSPGKTAHGMTEAKVNRIRPLLEAQSYIDSVLWSPTQVESSLNGFRDHMAHGNLADAHLATQGLDWSHRVHPWLSVKPNPKYRILFSRSMRYRNHSFPWQSVVYRYGAEAAFVGFQEEYENFCRDFGYVRFAEQQSNLLELAELIAGCELFVGNQSSPLAVAHGLKHNLIMEICPGGAHPHCVFQRANCLIGWDGKIELPILDDVCPKFNNPRDYELWREVYHGREYKIPNSFSPNTVVIDIGAHVGAFSLSALHRGAKHAICVEPCSTNLQHLNHNLVRHSYSVIPRALYRTDENVSMEYAPDSEGTVMFIKSDGLHQCPSVSWLTLSQHVRGYEHVIVKCDAEGAEYILTDQSNDLSGVEMMFIETHDHVIIDGVEYSNHDCISSLVRHGFKVNITKNGPNTHILEATR